MKTLILTALLVPAMAFAQTFPSPTFNSITLENPLATSMGGTGSATATGTGSVVLSTSPTLVAPSLGTPTSLTLTNATGLPISTGVLGLGSGVAASLSNPVTGSGSPVLATSPTIAGPTITGTLNGSAVSATSYAQNIPLTGSSLPANCSLTIPVTNYCVNQFTIGGSGPFDNASLANPGAFVNGFALVHNYGGSTVNGGRQTFYVQSTLANPTSSSNTNRNYVAGEFIAQAASGDGGTGTTSSTAKGGIFAMSPVAVAYAGATNLLELTGAEVNTQAMTGSSMYYKAGWTIVQTGLDAVQGSTYDAGIGFSNQPGAVGWQNGILFGPMNGVFPVTTTGCLICSTGSATAATGIDFSSMTLTNFLRGPGGFFVSGTGGVVASNGIFSGSVSLGYVNPTVVLNDTSGSSAANLEFANNGTISWILHSASTNGEFALQRFVGGVSSDKPISISNSTGVLTVADGIAGVTSGANAAAGTIGEILTNSTTGTSLTSSTTANATSKLLTAGDWDVQCDAFFSPSAGATITSITVGVNTTSAALPALGGFAQINTTFNVGNGQTLVSPVQQINVSSSTTVFCPVNTAFSGGTMTVSGFIRARRTH